MASRLLIGQHPGGSYGLFLSKPDVNVVDVGSADVSNLLFSSDWNNTLNIVGSGGVGLETTFFGVDQGFLPLIRFDLLRDTDIVDTAPLYSDTQFVNDDERVSREFTRYQIVYNSNTSYYIARKVPDLDKIFPSGYSFRYVIFNVPVQ